MIKETIKDIISQFLNYVNSNKGKSLGTFFGIIVSIMILSLGFFKALFIILCASLGYVIGDKIDEGENLKDLFLKIFFKND